MKHQGRARCASSLKKTEALVQKPPMRKIRVTPLRAISMGLLVISTLITFLDIYITMIS